MIIYFYLFILLLFLSADSSSIRSRSFKNELVPFVSSRSAPSKKDSNSMKIISNEPFIIQLQMPNLVERETKRSDEKEKKRKRQEKKRISKTKGLRKKNRRRRDLLTSKAIPQEKSDKETQNSANGTEHHLKNFTKNSINRMEILKALSSYSKIIENRRHKLEGIKNAEKSHNEKRANLHKRNWLFSERTPHVTMVYPTTPKFDENQQKYTYKDIIDDRERLEQKIKYIKNMLNANATAADDSVRVRRRSDSDRTANKIAKMFLTLSAVNGLHDRRKSKCGNDDDEEDDVWDKERRNNPIKKSVSSNEERYKVKKWIEFIKNKRTSSKTCPCMTEGKGEDFDIFPLEQKLSKDYNLERGRSSEESSESYGDPFYYSRDRLENNSKKMFLKSPDQENKIKTLTKSGKKKLGLPINDLEQYRLRAKQILQNAEEILDRIKQEEERRLATPSVFVNQLRELTSRIQGDPRNNENELIQKLQKNLGWGPLAKTIEGINDQNFMDNVKSYILDPYEKAKALTDESTRKLSSYLLRNLGKLDGSSEEEKDAREKDHRGEIQVFFEHVPQKEEKPESATLAKEQVAYAPSNNKEDPQNWENAAQLPTVVEGNEANDEKDNLKSDREKPFKQKVEDIIKAQQKKLDEYKVMHYSGENSREINNFDESNIKEAKQPIEDKQLEKEVVKDTKGEKNQGQVFAQLKGNESEDKKKQAPQSSESTNIEETERTGSAVTENGDATETDNPDFIEKKKNSEKAETPAEKADETNFTVSENMKEEKEFEAEIEEMLKTKNEKYPNTRLSVRETNNSEGTESETITLREGNTYNDNMMIQDLEKLNLDQGRSTEQVQSSEEESEKFVTSSVIQDTNFEGKTKDLQNTQREENSNTETLSEKQERSETKTNEKDQTKPDREENNFTQSNEELLETFQNTKDTTALKDTSEHDQDELLKDKARNLSHEEITQSENSVEKTTEQGDVVQETNRDFEELMKGSYPISTDSILKNNEEPDEDSLTLKSIHFEDNISKEKADDSSRLGLDIKHEQKELHEALNENESTTPLDEQNSENLNKNYDEKNAGETVKGTLKLENRENFDSANEDDIKPVNPENQQNESLEKSYVGSENDMASQTSITTEETSNESSDKSRSEEVNLKTALDEKNLEASGQDGETSLKTVQSGRINKKDSGDREDSVEERSEKTPDSNEEDINEPFLKNHLNKNQDSDQKNYDETNPYQNEKVDEKENSEEDSDKTLLKAKQDEEIYNEKDGEKILKSVKIDYGGKDQEKNENDESFNEEGSSETSRVSPNEKESESLMERGDENSGAYLKIVEDSLKKDKVASTNAHPQPDDLDENHSRVPLSNNEEPNIKGSEETNLNETNQSQENLKVDMTLKSSSENQNRESPTEVENNESSLMPKNSEADTRDQEVDQKSNDDISDETLEVNEETQGKLEEAGTGETLREGNVNEEYARSQEAELTNLRAPLGEHVPNKLEEMNGEQIRDQTNSKESEQEQDSLKDKNESSPLAVLENEERATEIDNDESDLVSKKNKSHEVEVKMEEQDDNEIENNQSSNDDGNALEEDRENPLEPDLEDKELENADKIYNEETLREVNLQDHELENLEKFDNEKTLQELNRQDHEIENPEKVDKDKTLREVNPQDHELENLERVDSEDTLQELNPDDHELENLENVDNEETLRDVNPDDHELENLENVDNEETLRDVNPQDKELENPEVDNEETLREVNPQDHELENLEKVDKDKTLREVNPQDHELENLENVDNEETLRDVNPDDHELENLENVDNEETLREINPDDHELENLENVDNEEILRDVNPQDHELENLENVDNEETLREINPDDHELENLENVDNEEILRDVNPQDHELENLENVDNEEILRDVNPQDHELENLENVDNEETLREINPDDHELENLEKVNNDETLQEVNFEDEEKDLSKIEGDETLIRAHSEDESQTKVKEFLETPLSSEASEEKRYKELNIGNVIEETDHGDQDSNNQIDEENEKTQSPNFDNTKKRFLEESYEMLRKEGFSGENGNVEDEEAEPDQKNSVVNPQRDLIRSSLTDLLQKSDFPRKPLKTIKLKVPKSIGKIMEDLGQEKDDVTSIQNLNPDKIDHIIYKIDEAEHQNLQQNQETDCRKECACADDIDHKSRNIGRYEIVKDFLHWMKDLQLNRVLSDD